MLSTLLSTDTPSSSLRRESASEMNTPHTWHGEVSKSVPEHPAICQLFRILREFAYTEHDIFALRVALGEALANAHKHGNHRDPDKLITMTYEITPEQIVVRVRDQGEGFNPADVPDPRTPANLENPNGRGLMMMHQFMTWVQFNQRGNEVTLGLVRTVP